MTDRVSDGKVVPPDVPLRIETVTAYIALDPEDNVEGIPAFDAGGVAFPMIAADHEMVLAMRPRAEAVARELGLKVSLVRFSTREVLIEDITHERKAVPSDG